MTEKKIERQGVFRILAGLLGVGLGVWLSFAFLNGFQGETGDSADKLMALLPSNVREQVYGLLGAPPTTETGQLEASGIIQAEEISIAGELGGRIVAIAVEEGDAVEVGDLLVQLDCRLLDAQIQAAEALVALAEAGLGQAQAGARPGQIAIAEAQLAQAQSARDAASLLVSDTLALVENPQDIRMRLAVSCAQIDASQHRVNRAEALRDAAGVAKAKFEEMRATEGYQRVIVASGSLDDLPDQIPPEFLDQLSDLADGVYSYEDWGLEIHEGTFTLFTHAEVSLPLQFHLAPNEWWQAWVGVNAAYAQLEGAQGAYYSLFTQNEHPQYLEAQVDEALSALAQAEAQVSMAEAQLDGLRAGATAEQIAALEAQVAQAQTAVSALRTQRSMMALDSPLGGTVVHLSAFSGEVVAPGAAILTIANLGQTSLSVYVPENRIGQIYLGQRVSIRVDSFPGRDFDGWVSYISDQAEFTPRNVSTKDERVNLVFSVEVEMANQDRSLKPGMPADAVFEWEGEGKNEESE